MFASLHLCLYPLHGATPDTVSGGNLQDADAAFRQGTLNAGLGLGIDLRAAQRRAISASTLQASIDATDDHRSLELGKDAKHLKHRLTSRCGRIDALLMQIQVNASRVDFAQEGDKVLERAAKAINAPGCNH